MSAVLSPTEYEIDAHATRGILISSVVGKTGIVIVFKLIALENGK